MKINIRILPGRAVMAALVALLVWAPAATADPLTSIDDAYLSGLEAKGITSALSEGLPSGWVHSHSRSSAPCRTALSLTDHYLQLPTVSART